METAKADPLILDTPRNADAAARSRMYALLADALAYPTGDGMTRLLNGSLLDDLREAAAALPEPVAVPETLTVASGGDADKEMQIVYTGLFEVCAGRPAVSQLERRHGVRDEPEQKLWEDLLRYYTFFGLDFSNGSTGENPDHLLTELAFMHYLCFLEAGAQRGLDDLRRGQRDFLMNHLGAWTPRFADALAQQNDTGPYAALGKLLGDVIKADIQYLREAPSGSEATGG
jgi:DMSO reductase family type II enzyme chaperone